MVDVRELLAQTFQGRERLTATEIYQQIVAAGAPPEVIGRFQLFPEGVYTEDEAAYTFDDLFDPTPEVAAAADADAHVRTGADQPWEPEDLAVAEGHDPTPKNVERARHQLDDEGPAAIERTVP